jgi:transcriptional regulator with XRE-family HTH domain
MSSIIRPPESEQKSREDRGTGSATLAPEGFDRQRELAGFLRQSRARITPEQAGLAGSSRRRTPGLRREELAALAGISIDWYIRLEQGRAERPSPSVIDALSRALQLNPDERAHLYALARSERPPLSSASGEDLDPSMARILHSLPATTPAYVLGWRWDILAWNQGACELLIDFGAIAPDRRNLVELTFLDAGMRDRYLDIDLVARTTLMNFRAAAARHLDRPEAKALVDHLLAGDENFATWWGLHQVQEKTAGVKRFRRPDAKPQLMHFESVLSPTASDQRLVIYTPADE